MPIYDYKCRKCAHQFEQLVKAGETPVCPSCGAAKPERFFPFSASVSTGRMRERAVSAEHGKARAVKKEKDHAHQEYMRNHIKDHS
jgi:putative FmdB family regulatory protein